MSSEDWDQQMTDDESNPQMTLDEYKRQREAKRKTAASTLPKLHIRAPGEGDDPRWWVKPAWIYRKANIDQASERKSDEENVANESKLIKPCQMPYASSNSDHQDQDKQQPSPSQQPTSPSTAEECQETRSQHPYLRAQSATDNGDDVSGYGIQYPRYDF